MLGNPLLLGDDGYNISRSVRLRSSASAYLSKALSSSGNRKTWTMSMWLKRGTLSTYQMPFSCFQSGGGALGLQLNTDNTFEFYQYYFSYQMRLVTTQVFRDPSAWYHFVFAVDTTQATASNRIKIYVNGGQITSFSTATYPTQNTDLIFNYAQNHAIGEYADNNANYFDGYLTEINFIDGQALTASSFGEIDAITGVWKPKKYAGTYGTNGFYLNFSDNSNNTAATIGKDSSGNGNNWTPNNISVTAGATYDSMLDVPTMWADGGNGRGNYAVLNPLGADSPSSTTANGNLTLSNSASNQKRATIPVVSSDTNKYYWEVTINGTATGNFPNLGMYMVGAGTNWVGYDGNSIGLYQGGGLYYNGSLVATLTSFANGDVIGIAYDPVTGKIWFAKNGTWMASGVPSTGTSPNYTLPTGVDRVAGGYTGSGYGTLEFNFGQRPFSYTPPTGFKALNTQNLPDATIKKGNAYFDATTYTGNGSTQSIVNAGGFQPDFVWIKDRSAARSHRLFDAVRGATKALFSDATDAETTLSTDLTAFNSNGFSLGAGAGSNSSGETFVGWQWKESVSAGFDIVTYTFSTAGTNTINHSLGVAPKFIIMKDRSFTYNWDVYHASVGYTQRLILNSTGAATSGFWAAVPTSTQFSVTSAAYNNNDLVVAHLFAEVAGFSRFGSYVGNGSTDGVFVHLGFKARWLMIKKTSATSNWSILDTARDDFNVADNPLLPNSSAAETTSTSTSGAIADILSNGFKLRGNSGDINDSGATYIYAAFAENPFKNSLAR